MLGSISIILIWLRIGYNYRTYAKRGHESFKEYTQRWKDLVAQVAPPMTKREMIIMMVDTFVEAKLHGESKVNQRCFDDNNDDNKR